VSEVATRTVRLHIGPYKTGSTSVQAVLDANARRLSGLGVLYPQAGSRPGAGHFDATCDFVESIADRLPPADSFVRHYILGASGGRRGLWRSLVDALNGHEGLSIVSTEFLCRFDASLVRQLMEQLPDHRIEVVMVRRRAASLLPSLYQENAKRQTVPEFEDYVRRALTDLTSDRRTPFDGIDSDWIGKQWAEAGPITVVDARAGMSSDVIRRTCLALSPALDEVPIPALNRGMSAVGVQLWRLHSTNRRPRYVGALRAVLARMLQEFPVTADPGLGGALRLSAAGREALGDDPGVHERPLPAVTLLRSGKPLTEPTPSLGSWQTRENLKWLGVDAASIVLPRPRAWRLPTDEHR
jgi:hypothetical protein